MCLMLPRSPPALVMSPGCLTPPSACSKALPGLWWMLDLEGRFLLKICVGLFCGLFFFWEPVLLEKLI